MDYVLLWVYFWWWAFWQQRSKAYEVPERQTRTRQNIKLRQKRLRRPLISRCANNTCNYLNERAWCKLQLHHIYSKNVSHAAGLRIACRNMHLSMQGCGYSSHSLISLKSTLFMRGLRVVKSIYHHCGPWQELIAGQFIRVCIGRSQQMRGVKAQQLTTAAARSAPSEVQLRTSVSTPNTIILQTHRKETARSPRSSVQQSASQMQLKTVQRGWCEQLWHHQLLRQYGKRVNTQVI